MRAPNGLQGGASMRRDDALRRTAKQFGWGVVRERSKYWIYDSDQRLLGYNMTVSDAEIFVSIAKTKIETFPPQRKQVQS